MIKLTGNRRITIHHADQKGYTGTFGVSSNIASVFGYTTRDKKVYLSVEKIKKGDFNNYFNIYSTLFHDGDPNEGHKSETIPYKYQCRLVKVLD
jgi:hypothetical protein